MGGGLFSLYIALGINSIPSYARIVRGVVLSQKEKEYVEAARMTGESELSILFLQVLPNCLSPLLIRLSLDFGHAILAESSLSFLGLGLPPPTASWGLMLKEITPFLQLQPMAAFFPGLTISLIILGLICSATDCGMFLIRVSMSARIHFTALKTRKFRHLLQRW